MASETEIYLPETLPYPIEILSLIVHNTEPIASGSRLLNYSFLHIPNGGNVKAAETLYGSWDATFEGELKTWNIRVGDRITAQRAKERHALVIAVACGHGVLFNGLCALCGMDMENFDYTGRPESARATIQMTHSASGPTVSLEEAQRIERETAGYLLEARKLSLIVDLDQTIVHTTVDPTVGDWISEGEAWEERRVRRERKANGVSGDDSDGDSDDTDTDDEEEEVNPNWEALKDVKKFRLAPDTFGAPSRSRWSSKDKGKEKSIQNDGCLYFVKPRPGWQEFLPSVAKKYEMHVYTMGTRAYAEEVCAAIDPDGSLFGGRILTRDESGSLTQKSLRRLFPCDTSMVVIIDDRADVWEWCPNLLKVIPYEFFVGIGDINSAFLPKLVDPLQQVSQEASTAEALTPIAVPCITISSSGSSIPEQSPSELSAKDTEDQDISTSVKEEMMSQNTIALEAQVEERPLAKQQELLEENEDDSEGTRDDQPATNPEVTSPQNGQSPTHLEEFPKHKHHRKALLKNDDAELTRLGMLLDEVHQRFFLSYDNRHQSSRNPNQSGRKGSVSQSQPQPFDVKTIIPAIRMETFAGVHILFSGVIPTNSKVPYEETAAWRMARAFGATCHRDLSPEITHVVTVKRGTQKVEKARARGNIFVVWQAWFDDSITHWRRQDERLYLLDDDNPGGSPAAPTASSPPSDPNAISTDTEPEELVGGDGDEDVVDPEADKVDADAKTGDGDEQLQMVDDADVDSMDVPLALDSVDWADVNDEVDAAMMEDDSEDEGGSDTEGVRRRRMGSRASSVMSEDEALATDDAASTVSGLAPPRRKRLRSLTPSEYGINFPQSPLAKRKKLAADRSGLSKLKETISARDIHNTEDITKHDDENDPKTPVSINDDEEDEDEDGEGEEEGGDDGGGEEIDDDFLLSALEEELG